MAYNEQLADRVRNMLRALTPFEEKFMFGGIAFMVDEKMCVGIVKDELMCRIHPEKETEALKQSGAKPMIFTGKPMKGYLFVEESGYNTDRELQYWLQLCLEFNPLAKKSGKK
ncbi:MAG: TfoX/Sxy family protein [Bacteroidetes bacterium]|nr:TfoX/Sxy family protein [Bacteroidota bacterium]